MSKDPATIPFDSQGINYRAYLTFAECVKLGHLITADKIRLKYGNQFPSNMDALMMFGFCVYYQPMPELYQ